MCFPSSLLASSHSTFFVGRLLPLLGWHRVERKLSGNLFDHFLRTFETHLAASRFWSFRNWFIERLRRCCWAQCRVLRWIRFRFVLFDAKDCCWVWLIRRFERPLKLFRSFTEFFDGDLFDWIGLTILTIRQREHQKIRKNQFFQPNVQ